MYERFYALNARPFQLMPDPRLVFESRNHTRALSYLIYGMERREGFVVISGDVGTGKTLLLQTMLAQQNYRQGSVARVAMANIDGEAVLPAVAGAFGVAYKGRSKYELLDALVARLATTQGSLLIVDEAQACTVEALEELRVISNLQAQGRALVQIVLIGQTELRGVLARPSMAHLRQRIVASYHLQPLERDEVEGYIEHRLGKVGWRPGRPSIGAGVYGRIHEWTGGIPRRINLIMDRFLLFGFLEERQSLSIEDLESVIAEFEKEFAGDELALDETAVAAPSGGAAASNLNALTDRIAGLERALRNIYGDEQAQQLLSRHLAGAEQRGLVEALLRVDQLESLFSELRGSAPQAERAEPTQPALADSPTAAAGVDENQLSWSSASRDDRNDDSALKRYFRWAKGYYD
ncbi:AAA family ATPase [Salinisphaera sp. T31B1]|uniref:AAA family ATPase n=1 Tax=Salinisphaera sp. T31B1 TaxID=727963 RepID=UPI0033416365